VPKHLLIFDNSSSSKEWHFKKSIFLPRAIAWRYFPMDDIWANERFSFNAKLINSK